MVMVMSTCPVCGAQEVDAKGVRLVRCSIPSWSSYSFICPTCGDEVRKDAGDDVVRLLASAGVMAEPWHVPAEALEAHDGPPLDYDDLLDFVLDLRRAHIAGELLTLAR